MGVAMRRGEQYLASLRDGRAVFLDGARVDDVTKHPAFAPPIRRIAATWDLAAAADVQATTTFADPATGRRHSAMWLVPRSADDLAARRRVHRLWAEPSFGLMGRTPDHVACVLSALRAGAQSCSRPLGLNRQRAWVNGAAAPSSAAVPGVAERTAASTHDDAIVGASEANDASVQIGWALR